MEIAVRLIGRPLAYVKTEAGARLVASRLAHLHRQIGRARVPDENQTGRLVAVGAVRHPALLGHDPNVRHCLKGDVANKRSNKESLGAIAVQSLPPSIQART